MLSREESVREGLEKFPNSPILTIHLAWYHLLLALNSWSTNAGEDISRASDLFQKGLSFKSLSPLELRYANWGMAYIYSIAGEFRKALQAAEVALQLSPNDAFMRGDLAQAALWAGETEKALAWSDFAMKSRSSEPPLLRIYQGMGFNFRWEIRKIIRGHEGGQRPLCVCTTLASNQLCTSWAPRRCGPRDQEGIGDRSWI